MFSLLEYIKIHRISLNQDVAELTQQNIYNHDEAMEMRDLVGQLRVLDHLIKVAEETE